MKGAAELWDAQAAFSEATFPGVTPLAVARHLRSEAEELEAEPYDLAEWADALLLTFDGARRAGASLELLLSRAFTKLEVNRLRTWPPVTDPDAPVEHVR